MPTIALFYSTYSLIDMTKINGDLPTKTEKLVLEWMKLHIDELREMWDSQSFKRIEPLE